MIFNANARIFVELIDVFLKSVKRKLVTVFKLAVGCTIFLNCIISQMNKCIINIFQVDAKLWATRAQITFRKKVKVLILSKEDPDSDVKFPLMYE